MPEMMQKTDHMGNPTGQIDWSKIFMGFAVALVFVMQQWHSIQMSNIKSSMVPRAEIEKHTDRFRSEFREDQERFMDRSEILDAFRDFSKRIEYLEDDDIKGITNKKPTTPTSTSKTNEPDYKKYTTKEKDEK